MYVFSARVKTIENITLYPLLAESKKKWSKYIYFQNRNRLTDLETEFLVTKGEGSEGGKAYGLQQLWLLGSRAQAQSLWHMGLATCSMWDYPGLEMESASPALTDRLLTTEPPGKPYSLFWQQEGQIPSLFLFKTFWAFWNKYFSRENFRINILIPKIY